MEKSEFNLPNILTMIRIILVPVVLVLIFKDLMIPALIVFLVACFTDLADGYIARHYNLITKTGIWLDPLADKLMQCTALICVVARKLVPWWILIPIILKELTMGVGSVVFYKMFKQIGVAKNYGKAYTVIFYVVIAAIIVFYKPWFQYNEWATYALCIITAAAGFVAIVLYYRSYLKGKLGKKNRKVEN